MKQLLCFLLLSVGALGQTVEIVRDGIHVGTTCSRPLPICKAQLLLFTEPSAPVLLAQLPDRIPFRCYYGQVCDPTELHVGFCCDGRGTNYNLHHNEGDAVKVTNPFVLSGDVTLSQCHPISCHKGQKFEGDPHDDLIACVDGRACNPEGSYLKYEVVCATLENGTFYCSRVSTGK